jgi:hypothetical protein
MTTNPTGRSFLSYRRLRKDEAALLIMAQHDHGIPTWQDVQDLGSTPTEDEIRRVLDDPSTANGVLLITPEVEDSEIIRNVEIPKLIKRSEARDGFFVVPVAAGQLDYAEAAKVTSNYLSAQILTDWNLEKFQDRVVSASEAAFLANRILTQRMQAIHSRLPAGAPLNVGLFVRRPPAFELGHTLTMNWFPRFTGKETTQAVWNEHLLPALSRVANAIRKHAPGRDIHAFGLPTLPAAISFGCQFLSTSGLRASWRQVTRGQPDQLWNLDTNREKTGFQFCLLCKTACANDVGVLVSVADNVEPLFARSQASLPPLRAIGHVFSEGKLPHMINTPGQAVDIANTVQEAMRELRRQYGKVGTVHLFAAIPAGLGMLIGQLLSTFSAVQTYEHLPIDETEIYRPAALLRPCE